MRTPNPEKMSPFGRHLLALRKAENLRQEDLADALEVSRETISYYESRAGNPTMEFVEKVADHFGTSVDELLGRTKGRGKRGPASKLERQFELVRQLSLPKQKVISDMLDMAIASERATEA